MHKREREREQSFGGSKGGFAFRREIGSDSKFAIIFNDVARGILGVARAQRIQHTVACRFHLFYCLGKIFGKCSAERENARDVASRISGA